MLRVGFATTDGICVNQHFGWATRFDVYDISTYDHVFVGSRLLTADGQDGPDGEANRLDARIDLIRDCSIIHMAAIGGGAAARITNARIHPVKVPESTEISSLLARLRTVIAGNPPPWLRKLLAASATSSDVSPQ